MLDAHNAPERRNIQRSGRSSAASSVPHPLSARIFYVILTVMGLHPGTNHSGSFQPGNTLGKGRPPGVRNRASYALRERLKTRGDIDPADFLSGIVSNPNEPQELRASAAIGLMPYLYNKLTPVAPLVFIEEPISIPRPTTITFHKHTHGPIRLSNLSSGA